MEGILVVNKPNGITSHDVVAKVRKKFKIKRVGHAGTLDPLATGVLIVLLGRSTKLFDQFVGFDKAYRATLILGQKTDTADTQGKVVAESSYAHVTKKQVEDVFKTFTGALEQLPPMYSAVKIKGKKLYELARQGIEVKREPRQVHVYRLELESMVGREVRFYLECSKGTYVRQLADDIGDVLGCGACISKIERTKVGSYSIDESVKIEELNESHIRSWKP